MYDLVRFSVEARPNTQFPPGCADSVPTFKPPPGLAACLQGYLLKARNQKGKRRKNSYLKCGWSLANRTAMRCLLFILAKSID